ncbi:TPA: hypothetical protein EYN98_29300 [Candidatus Poribacteria bacterium]|jgi:hypothetical protein|nr:hypothetical protein [Candidatus Poribacteria bacterium]HIB89334.1 hypothetical protein [Candidatus Poribacteria bacterium]HIC00044.1 hypothetical protein [Candidatus Poribacteria bacterium]HIM10912.1 hypothetical protein [Candidatus Poribacteria bacterium]HIN29243.1 hypothetical protein [Candidatus Poribacteria bacterium]
MKVEPGVMIQLGYGKYFRSESIMGLEPIEEERGPGKRTNVYIEGFSNPIVASRGEGAILHDLTRSPDEIIQIREHTELLKDLLDSISGIPPMLRSIIRDQGNWDLDRLERHVREILETELDPEDNNQQLLLSV